MSMKYNFDWECFSIPFQRTFFLMAASLVGKDAFIFADKSNVINTGIIQSIWSINIIITCMIFYIVYK